MEKFFVKENQININTNTIEIIGKDQKHISKVLRKQIGDKIIISDDNSNTYLSSISVINDEKITCEIIEKLELNNENKVNIDLFQCLAKFDKMDYIFQKATELGITNIYPVISNRCVVKLDEQGKSKKVDRWQKIVEEASKQCKRTSIPTINNVISLSNICNLGTKYDIILLAYENDTNSLRKVLQKTINTAINIGVIIGPEGGFDESEISMLLDSNNIVSVSLGKRILRTETASIVLISNILYELGEI